jgi:hypothetical protein
MVIVTDEQPLSETAKTLIVAIVDAKFLCFESGSIGAKKDFASKRVISSARRTSRQKEASSNPTSLEWMPSSRAGTGTK